MKDETIYRNNHAVVISKPNDLYSAILFTNARGGIMNATITSKKWTGKRVENARKWAEKILADK